MSVDYIVSSLPPLSFSGPAPFGMERFWAACTGDARRAAERLLAGKWRDLESELRNAMAGARGAERFCRPAKGCSLYWRGRVAACFQEKDVMKRETLLDKVWWDAAGTLADVSSPLGVGALAAYAVRLGVALRRDAISAERGLAVFDSSASAPIPSVCANDQSGS